MRVSLKNIPFGIFILPLISSVIEAVCPSKCNCTEEEVFCVSKNIEKIPNFDPLDNNPLVIDLSGNKIAMIGRDDLSFEKSNVVKEIYLNNSELIDIDEEAFDDMDNLQEIYLMDNLLTDIPENFIQDLPNMILLHLAGNPFEGNMPVIRSETLEVLVLANCKITTIPPEALTYLPNLRLLLLHENNIEYINPEVFESVSSWLYIRLSYNTWKCDCKTLELFNYLSKKEYIDLTEPYQCTNDLESVNIYDFIKSEEYKNMCNIDNPTTSTENDHKEKVDKRNLLNNTETKNNNITDPNFHIDIGENYTFVPKNDNDSEDYGLVLKIALIASLISFLIGIFFGFFLHQCIAAKQYLENSDSTSKLITSSN